MYYITRLASEVYSTVELVLVVPLRIGSLCIMSTYSLMPLPYDLPAVKIALLVIASYYQQR